ncbi:MAG: Na+/H+ antiporter [Prevotellaceae bacterium]|nr:Na+/H+ antiporter [Prevotellaceae bacterium]
MELYSIIIILLAVAIGLSPVAKRMKLPYPVLLLAAGIIVGFIPGFHRISINPEIVFLIFLPPMLYDAAYNISFKDFRANLPTISLLAIVLVFVTTTAIAVAVHYCIPGMTWSLSFVLGAILSPPDAIAATSVTKGLGLPHRTNIILEGESLINDASALVAFRFAVAAVAGSAFIAWKAGVMFLVALIGGFLVGCVIWILFAFLVKKKKLDSNVIVSLNLLIPFVAYLIAEELHVSGVIAVVTAGLIISQHRDKFPEQTNNQSKFTWNTLTFILNGLVFILIGIEFPHVLKNIPFDKIFPLIGCAFLIFGVALLIRMSVIFWHKLSTEKRFYAVKKHLDKPEMKTSTSRFHRKNYSFKEILDNIESLLLNWKEAVIIGWSGMRGIVSLAAALSLPLIMDDGSAFPQRDTIIFLTVSVVILMLVIQGLGLPLLVKLLKMKEK